ncbi:MAG TPA: hypothetical protein VFK88_12785 [Gallionella sp.]|nr:hypothetical protein [Gallionella sp.]
MNSDRADLEARYKLLSDDEIKRFVGSGNLTELAQSVAMAELKRRGWQWSLFDRPDTESAQIVEHVRHDADMSIVARHLTPTDAHILRELLQAEGVPAEVGDANVVQVFSGMLASGAYIRVPRALVPKANEVISAFDRGEFRLDDFDLDETQANPVKR